jgi:5'-phosphate synthase pdxT subunit
VPPADRGRPETGLTVGVLALQGDFERHRRVLERLGVAAVEVRKPAALDGIAGLVMPGGESTTLLKLMAAWDFVPALERFHAAGRPIFGTCAGLILLAREVERPRQFSLGFIDITAERNAYGRQKESFEAEVTGDLGSGPVRLPAIFIRAPRIRRLGPGVSRLVEHRGECVMARQGTVLVAAFHPELTDDPAVHRYFLEMVRLAVARPGDGGPSPVGRASYGEAAARAAP